MSFLPVAPLDVMLFHDSNTALAISCVHHKDTHNLHKDTCIQIHVNEYIYHINTITCHDNTIV